MLNGYAVCLILGMLLTLHDAGATDIKLTGSRLAREYLSATNVFMRPFNNFTPVEATEPLKCSVDNIEVCAVPITSGDGQVERVCYIGSTPEIAGKFVLEKAVALGVPKGPLFGKLKSGQAVTLPSGSIVHPSEVLDPPEPGRTFIIVPSIGKDENDLLNSLLGSNIISSYRSTGSPSSKQAHKV